MSFACRKVEESGPLVVARDLTVEYGGKGGALRGLNGFSAHFQPGITGLVGPNGAGKTSFLRVAMGLLTPSAGTLEIQGIPPRRFVSSGKAGFLPENPLLLPFLRVGEFLDGLRTGGAPGGDNRSHPGDGPRLRDLLERPIGSLSLGQRKAVALSAVLLEAPKVLLLDEPTNGLDPRAVRELRDTLLEERSRGRTIIISSHHLDELQRIADALVFVREGRVAGVRGRREEPRAFQDLEVLFDQMFGEE